MIELDRLAEIQKLAKLPPLEYDRVRTEMAKRLGCRVATLDEEVRRLRPRNEPNRFEHSNTHVNSQTGTGATGSSNGCSNGGGVRTLEELSETAKPLIEAPDVLACVQQAIVHSGYAGDPKPVVLIYVALSSRLLDKPVNVHVVAPSSTGKNFAINAATQLFPDEALVKLSAMSPKALIYGSDDLRNKTVVLAECDSLLHLEGNAATLVRSIIEDARTDFDVVERDPETNRNMTRRVPKEGPTGLLTSGVRELELQTATRVLTLHLSDTPQQTRAILRAQAALARGQPAALDTEAIGCLVDFQRWLAAQPERRIVVPFADVLAEELPVGEIRMRRDFKQLLSIVKTIALLNQRHRGRNADGAIVAELADYRWARELLFASFRSIVTGGITDVVRETCLAVPEEGEASEAQLVERLGLTKSTIYYRVGRALRGGWLTNLEHRRGHAYRLVRAAPLPEEQSPLPTVESLQDLFEHRGDSNGYSNGLQTIGREGKPISPFGCSSGRGTDCADDEGIDLYPDDEGESKERKP
jgi:hypothetical protein